MEREVWIWAEQRRGQLMTVSLELLGKADELAHRLGATVAAVIIGEGVEPLARELAFYGAGRVYLVEDTRLCLFQGGAYTTVLADLAKRYCPEILLLGATGPGRGLSATVAARLGTGLTAHCIDLYINDESRLVQVVPGLADNTMLEFISLKDPQMATVKPGVFPKPERDESRRGDIVRVTASVQEKDLRAETIEVVEEAEAAPLETADTVVAGGWGIHAVGGFKLVKELARVLGGAVGGTRPAVDKGWIPEELMIGQSGKTVSPKLFISLGASGAMHFTTGFTGSRVILAIDQNPRAPIFDVADVGIVGDLREVLPLLLEEFNNRKNH